MNPASTPSRIRWLLILWMFLAAAIVYLDRVNMSVMGQAIAKEFHLSHIQLGWVFSALIAGYALFQAPAGWAADRFGPRLVLAAGVLWWSVFTSMITLLSASMAGLLVIMIAVRFCLGSGEAVVFPSSNCVVAAWIPSSERGKANGFIFAGVGFGAGITPPLVTYLLIHSGWRASFWASSVLGLAAGWGWYAIARNKPAEHPWVNRGELELIQDGLPKPPNRQPGAKLSWSAIVCNPEVLKVTLSYFAFGYSAYIFFSWFFIYVSSARGLDLKQSSYYSMLPFLAMAIASPLGGWISDRITRGAGKWYGRCVFSAGAMCLSAGFMASGTQVASAGWASLVLAGGAGALYLSQSCFWSTSADIGKSSAGSVSGFMNMGNQTAGAITASLTPVIAKHLGWTASFLVAAGLSVVGAISWLALKPEKE
jgi:ACS family glucarate transporter-like MFS transporter